MGHGDQSQEAQRCGAGLFLSLSVSAPARDTLNAALLQVEEVPAGLRSRLLYPNPVCLLGSRYCR